MTIDRSALLEGIERDAWLDLYAAAPPPFAAAAGLAATPVGEATVLTLRAVGQTQFNRILGLGLATPATQPTLDAALAHMAACGNPAFFLHLAPGARPGDLPDWLKARGLKPYHRPWAKFWRGDSPPPEMPTALSVVEIGPGRAGDFAAAVAEGFGAPPPFAGWLAALPGRAGWRIFVAYDGDRPVAGGALYCRGTTGWLGIAATRPGDRGRGAQRALMAARIGAAVAGGCRDIATETGVAVPGEPNASYNNMLRCGFTVAYLRDNYVGSS